jgi:uncharacterized protein YecT (DUF1311 family)
MKIAPILAVALATFTFHAFAEDDEEEPVQTQAEMTQQADEDFEKADEKMSAAYRKFKGMQDEDGAAKLKTAQKAWLAYRDAEATFEAAPNKGGSIYSMVYDGVRQRITEARTKELVDLINEANEGTDAGTYNPDGADDPNM